MRPGIIRQPNRPAGSPPAQRGIQSTRLHLTLYSLLLVVTPFIMLRNYLQSAIGRLSLSTIPLGGLRIPAVPAAALLVALALLAIFRPRITRRRVIALLVGLFMVAVAQRITDYYFGHRFYELQVNWHYLAYGLFSFLAYRHFRGRGIPIPRCMLLIFGLATLYSAFDEGFQLVITSRIFDMSDIGKDAWGAFTGITMILVGAPHGELAQGRWKKIRHRRLQAYFRSVPSVWLILLVIVLLFLCFASLLTESQHVLTILVLTITSFFAIFALIHLSQYTWGGRVIGLLLLLAVIGLGTSCVRHRRDGIVANRFGLTVYRGIPIPFFDVMVFPDGGFRLVDKKHFFNSRDRDFFNRKASDIILIGAGYRDEGGKGYPQSKGSRFLFSSATGRGVQVIILNSADACRRYNSLKQQGKNVLLILHTTC